MTWIIWCAVLFFQNFAFTIVSRARNSSSVRYHALASVGSNGMWFLQNVLLIDMLTTLNMDRLAMGVCYIVLTTAGALTSHFIALRFERRFG